MSSKPAKGAFRRSLLKCSSAVVNVFCPDNSGE
ncbi:Uncharacterised protein [Vibrio cholerae]|nr:Uncharacterised protein [Vibrio cholerae]